MVGGSGSEGQRNSEVRRGDVAGLVGAAAARVAAAPGDGRMFSLGGKYYQELSSV